MKKSALKKPIRSKDVPATRGMLYLVRDELNHSITSLEHKMVGGFKDVDARFNESDAKFKSIDARFNEMEARFKEIDARFDKMEARFAEIDARFDKMEARFEKIEAKLEQVLSAVHRIGLLVEEQNVRNKYVLDGYAQLYEQINKSKNRDT